MALILRHCILSQRKQLGQKFLLFHHNVCSSTYINSNIKKCGSILHMKHFSTEDEKKHIYKGPITKQLYCFKLLCWGTSFISAVAQPVMYMKAMEDGSLASAVTALAIINLAVVFSPLYFHIFTRRYVIDMFYYPKEDMYVAEVYNIFLKRKQIIFRSHEAVVPTIGGMFTSCVVNGYPLLFVEEHFSDPKYYCVLMGYNEPIDFEMGPKVTNTQEISIKSEHEKLKDSERDYKQIETKR